MAAVFYEFNNTPGGQGSLSDRPSNLAGEQAGFLWWDIDSAILSRWDGDSWQDVSTKAEVDLLQETDDRIAAVSAEATLARNADNLTSGTVADARIASTIARDSEVSTAVAAEASARDAAIAAAIAADEFLTDTVLTVGSGGHYPSLSAAFKDLALKRATFTDINLAGSPAPTVPTVTLQLVSGYVHAEQLVLYGNDWSWVVIKSVDAIVPIQRSALTVTWESVTEGPLYPAFYFVACVSPKIQVLFDMDTSGTAAGRTGFQARHARVYFGGGGPGVGPGCINAGGRGLAVAHDSQVFAANTNWYGAGTYGMRISNNSTAHLEGADAHGCGYSGLHVGSGCLVQALNFIGHSSGLDGLMAFGAWVYAAGADLHGAAEYGVNCQDSAHINVSGANISGCLGVAAIYATGDGSNVNAVSANCSGSAGIGIYVAYARVAAHGANCSNAATTGVSAVQGSLVDFSGGTATGCGTTGAAAQNGSMLNLTNANVRKGASDSTGDIFVDGNSFVAVSSSTVGGMNMAGNVLNPSVGCQRIVDCFGTIQASSGTWNYAGTPAGGVGSSRLNNVGPAIGDYIEFQTELTAGTYTAILVANTGPDEGIVQLSVGGVNQGATIDLYSAAAAHSEVGRTGIAVARPGVVTVRATVTGKNASSSSYIARLNRLIFTRTA